MSASWWSSSWQVAQSALSIGSYSSSAVVGQVRGGRRGGGSRVALGDRERYQDRKGQDHEVRGVSRPDETGKRSHRTSSRSNGRRAYHSVSRTSGDQYGPK